jgi:hypothetical protein
VSSQPTLPLLRNDWSIGYKDQIEMSTATHRPRSLWSAESRTPSVSKYFRAYRGEFSTDGIESDFPYQGPASGAFRRLNANQSQGRLRQIRGQGNWLLGVAEGQHTKPVDSRSSCRRRRFGR